MGAKFWNGSGYSDLSAGDILHGTSKSPIGSVRIWDGSAYKTIWPPQTAVPVTVTGSSVTTVNTSGGVTSATVNYPSGSASGELIVLHVFTFRNATGTYTHTTPSGWNVAKTVDNQAAGQRTTVIWKVRGAETSVQLTSSAAVFWHVSATSAKDFFAAAPIENITDFFFLIENSTYHETPHLPVGSAAGILYWGGSAYGATGTYTELWERGTELQDATLAPSGVSAWFNFSTSFENVGAGGVVGPNIIKHLVSGTQVATQQHGLALAIRPSSWVEPAPLLDTISPRSASTAGGDTITLTGVGFKGTGATTSTTVYVDGAAVSSSNINVTDTGKLTFTAPAHAAGTINVHVVTSAGTSNTKSLTYATTSSAGMNKSGTQSVGANTTAKVTGWAAQAGTPAGAIVNNELVVSANGTISITATIGTSSTMNTSYIMIYKNGVEVARSATTSAASWSVTWTGSAVNTDSFSVYVRNGYFLSRTVNSGSLAYTLTGTAPDPGLPATTQVAADSFDGTGPLSSSNWILTGGGKLDRLNGVLSGDSTPSTPISFAWWKTPVGQATQVVRCVLRWNGRSPEHSAVGLVVRGDPLHSSGNPGTRNGVMFAFTATIMSLYYEDYNQPNGFVPVTGTGQYVNITKFPEGALIELRAEGDTYTALVDGVVQLQGTVATTIIPTTNYWVGSTIQNDELETGGGGPPGYLDDFVALVP